MFLEAPSAEAQRQRLVGRGDEPATGRRALAKAAAGDRGRPSAGRARRGERRSRCCRAAGRDADRPGASRARQLIVGPSRAVRSRGYWGPGRRSCYRGAPLAPATNLWSMPLSQVHDTMMNPRIETCSAGRLQVHAWSPWLACGPARSTPTSASSATASGPIVPPQVTSVARKPLSIAFEEIAADKIVAVDVPDVDEPSRPRRPTRRPRPTPTVRPRGCRLRVAGTDARRAHASCSACPGGIAAYKAVEVCRRLVDAGAHVAPVMTEGAPRFVGETTFSALASEPVADLAVATSATPSRTPVSARRPTSCWCARPPPGCSARTPPASPTTCSPPRCWPPGRRWWCARPCTPRCGSTRRCRTTSPPCARRGVHVVAPESGRLAGGDVGAGRLADPAAIVAAVERLLGSAGDLAGLRVLVTAGGTREPIDPVRVIANRSSGKQGHALAERRAARGAKVTLVTTIDPARRRPASRWSGSRPRPRWRPRWCRAAPTQRRRRHGRRGRRLPARRRWPTARSRRPTASPQIVLEPTPDILADLGRGQAAGPDARRLRRRDRRRARQRRASWTARTST